MLVQMVRQLTDNASRDSRVSSGIIRRKLAGLILKVSCRSGLSSHKSLLRFDQRVSMVASGCANNDVFFEFSKSIVLLTSMTFKRLVLDAAEGSIRTCPRTNMLFHKASADLAMASMTSRMRVTACVEDRSFEHMAPQRPCVVSAVLATQLGDVLTD